jgi:acyl carrier protein
MIGRAHSHAAPALERSNDEIRDAVLQALSCIVPPSDLVTLRPDLELRDQLDIDSMDFLNLAIGIHDELGVDVPESAYDELLTLDDFVRYLDRRIRTGSR